MTTATLTPARPLTTRIGSIVRLHLANPFTIVFTPLLILGVIFAVSWMIWWIVSTSVNGDPEAVQGVSNGFQFSGASLWIFFYMMVVAIQAMNLTFPLALGFGSTRRDFYVGSAVAFVGLSAFYAVLFAALGLVEEVTGGWGVGGSMFRAIYFGTADTPAGLRLFFVFALFLFFFFIGAAIAAMYVRWKQRGLIAFFAISALALIGGAALLTVTESWGAVGDFFGRIGFIGGYALSLIPTAIAGLAGYLIMRRATPRS
jgi:hypothetical protein